MSKGIVRICKYYVIALAVLLVARSCALTNVEPGTVGVRYNNVSGLLEEDLAPGWHFEVVGLQKVWTLPSSYLFLTYSGEERLSIRTKDNNTVLVDVSVPYRIVPGQAHKIMDDGNHIPAQDGRYRFERFANDTTISVLREHLAQLQSHDFYDTETRLRVSTDTLRVLNESLAGLHLEASDLLIRASYFRDNYEAQLARIQLNAQQKLLDGAKKAVADKQQQLDNYAQETAALVAANEQDWARKIADLDRAYQVGSVDIDEDRAPGAARRKLASLSADERAALVQAAAAVFSKDPEDVSDAHLLGIKNIQAETTEYRQRVLTEADGVSARLTAVGDAMVAKVKGDFERKLNALLGSTGGRAYVAYQAADNVKFEDKLTFRSADGIPHVLRLREFARLFMGQ